MAAVTRVTGTEGSLKSGASSGSPRQVQGPKDLVSFPRSIVKELNQSGVAAAETSAPMAYWCCRWQLNQLHFNISYITQKTWDSLKTMWLKCQILLWIYSPWNWPSVFHLKGSVIPRLLYIFVRLIYLLQRQGNRESDGLVSWLVHWLIHSPSVPVGSWSQEPQTPS